MSDCTREFTMVHSVVIGESMDRVFDAIIHVDVWPEIFPPCQAARIVENRGSYYLIEITATVNEELRTWRSEREVNKEEHRLVFSQTRSVSPIKSMKGQWVVEEEPIFGCRAYLIHDFVIESNEDMSLDEAEQWVRGACDRNSVSELSALKAAFERVQQRGEKRVRLNIPSLRYDQLLQRTGELFPDKTALVHRDRRFSFEELDRMVDAMAVLLTREFNVEKGDRVALTATPCPEVVITFQALARMGAVVTPVNPLYGEREVENQLRDSNAVLAVVSPSMHGAALNIIDQLPDLKNLMPFGPSSGFFEFLEKHLDKPFAGAEVSPEDLLALPYSSGTSGMPKGVMLTHGNLVANALQFISAHGVTNMDTVLNALPVLLSMHMGAGLASGATQILVDRWDVEEMVKLAEKEGATQVYTVTPLIGEMLNLDDLEERDLSRLKFVNSGASSLDLGLGERLYERIQTPVVQGYGLTEASPLTHSTPVLEGFQPPRGTCGRPIPETEQRILEPETGLEVPLGEVGLLYIRGPQVMKGYWKAPEETARVLQEGWLCTGDLVRADSEGFLFYHDRYKDVIKHRGHSIAPVELESVLKSHPQIEDAAVVALDLSHDEQKPFAFVATTPGTDLDASAVRDFANSQLAEYKHIGGVEFVQAIPRSGSGKLKRRILRDSILEGAALLQIQGV
ncbi:MAG: AMP-binding protein [Spirochaetales bacterium]|nr:AMP-binding protein [Spirochaetales bacterium]